MNTKRYKIESYEWANIPSDLPRQNLVLVTAKTTKNTYHPEDIELPPIRIFKPEELRDAARSLARREVGLNHRMVIPHALTVDANWNEKEQAVEALLYIPSPYIEEIRSGRINQVSVEYNWRSEALTDKTVEFQGLVFYRVDLLEGLNAGDEGTWMKLVEADKQSSIMGELQLPCDKQCKECGQCKGKEDSGETDIKQDMIQDSVDNPSSTFFKECEESAMQAMNRLGEPFAGYKDFSDCVSKNKDKSNPDAYCGYIKHKVEDPKKESKFPQQDTETAAYLAGGDSSNMGNVALSVPVASQGSGIDNSIEHPKKESIPLMKKVTDNPLPTTDVNLANNQVASQHSTQDGITGTGVSKEALGDSQVPEIPMNIMANEPTPISAIFNEPKLADKPKDSTMFSNVLGESNKDVMDTKGVNIKVTDEDKSKQRVESNEEKKEVKKEAVPPITPDPIIPPMPIKPEPTSDIPIVKASTVPVMTVEVQHLIESQAKELKDKDTAIAKLQDTVKTIGIQKDKAVKEAVEKTKTDIITKVESVLPNGNVISQWNRGGQLLAENIRKVIYQEKKKEE